MEIKAETKKGRAAYSSAKLWAKRAKKQAEADTRQAAHDKLTVKEKLAKVKYRVSQGMGRSEKEFNRLNKQYEAQKKAASPVTKPLPVTRKKEKSNE
jgi:hypothetical protein